jgi:hypothetical protein
MPKRVILTPLNQGSRTPEELREAVRKVVADRDVATWREVKEWESDPEEPLTEADPPSGAQQAAPPLTDAQPSAKLRSMKSRKRVLLEPATISPKRALIEAAVERVAAEREHRVAAEKAAARTMKVSHRSEPLREG